MEPPSCRTRGCQATPEPSRFVDGWLYCPVCKNFTPVDDD